MSSQPCKICGRVAPAPIRGGEADEYRATFRRAKIRDEIAFAFCIATVLITKENFDLTCKCDRKVWKRAIERFRAEGPEACWKELGLEP
jgi:hypothetical protein